ncbi:MAG: TRAP transporter small permease subunit [Okeania sp. SIO3I5]|uniref:TRAP transporter small permease subunit n=1 Tax=Okeania sp. SIO3I5 TaxID=2607805 RepID=UPI0013B9F20E|nr:TRAP transporter small permease subunit [Okeania sp. SIO3I5]NEQ39537.1 TRAP transporter small permease subunit [Okeania sp. SIO3I5]
MQILLRLSRIIDNLNELIGRLTYGLVILMVLVGVWNVIGRYLGRSIGQNLTSNALIEIQWYIFDLVFLLGGAYALKHNEHVRVDIFYTKWSPKRKALANLIGTILFLIPFSIIVVIVSWGAVVNSWAILETSPDPGGLPRYPIKTMIIVSFVLLFLQGISEAIKNYLVVFAGKSKLSPHQESNESEF